MLARVEFSGEAGGMGRELFYRECAMGPLLLPEDGVQDGLSVGQRVLQVSTVCPGDALQPLSAGYIQERS